MVFQLTPKLMTLDNFELQ